MVVAGCDEVGRGPLAGDVVAAAVILGDYIPEGLADSKKLSEKKGSACSLEIQSHAVAFAIGRASVDEIDEFNILNASLLAMKRAVEALPVRPDHVLVDGNKLPTWDYSAEAVVGGDGTVPAISAASILAKVTRDQELIALDAAFLSTGSPSTRAIPRRNTWRQLRRTAFCPFTDEVLAPLPVC